jgi:hypothetical protein
MSSLDLVLINKHLMMDEKLHNVCCSFQHIDFVFSNRTDTDFYVDLTLEFPKLCL